LSSGGKPNGRKVKNREEESKFVFLLEKTEESGHEPTVAKDTSTVSNGRAVSEMSDSDSEEETSDGTSDEGEVKNVAGAAYASAADVNLTTETWEWFPGRGGDKTMRSNQTPSHVWGPGSNFEISGPRIEQLKGSKPGPLEIGKFRRETKPILKAGTRGASQHVRQVPKRVLGDLAGYKRNTATDKRGVGHPIMFAKGCHLRIIVDVQSPPEHVWHCKGKCKMGSFKHHEKERPQDKISWAPNCNCANPN
jgi:hypothetical protein